MGRNSLLTTETMSAGNCAVMNKGAWWYQSCQVSNLNGDYLTNFRWTTSSSDATKGSEMKTREEE